jgi:hypothetical protein
MLLPVTDRIWDTLGACAAKFFGWTPIGKEVSMMIEASDDAFLVGKRIEGTVRACDFDGGAVLIELASKLDYHGRYLARDLGLIVACPVLRWHGPRRLLCRWSAVRLVDAPSFAGEGEGFVNTIATGRLILRTLASRRSWRNGPR